MEICDEKKKVSKRKFSETWLSDDRYKDWIQQVVSDDTFFIAKYAIKNILVHRMFPGIRILRFTKGIQKRMVKMNSITGNLGHNGSK